MSRIVPAWLLGAVVLFSADADVASYLERNPFSGTVLAQRGTTTLFHQGDPDLAYQIGSITKVFTAVGILKLQERGQLRLQDPVSAYVELLYGEGITIEQLLNHTSGIPDFFNEPEDFGRMAAMAAAYHPVTDILTLFAHRPLHFSPGSEYRYSNSGFAVLGAVIEKVSGKSYPDFVRDEILAPLGMSETGVLANPPNVATARGTTAFDGLPEGQTIDPSFYSSGGGIVSTARDLVLFGQALLSNTLLTEASFESMTTPRKGNYGLGWMAGNAKQPFSGGHNGRTIGFSAFFSVDRKSGTVVVLLAPSDLVRTDEIGANVAQISNRQ